MVPDKPLRPNSSVPGDESGTTTLVGVRASVHNTKRRGLSWVTSPRVSPTSLEPRSKRTILPSAPKVSVAVTQVVMPGSAELIAVSKVQSINAPFGNMKRCVGSTRALTAGVAVGLNSDAKVSPPDTRLSLESGLAPGLGGSPDGSALPALKLAPSPSIAGVGADDRSVGAAARTGPPNCRSSSNSAGVLGGGPDGAYGLAFATRISGAVTGSGGGGLSTASNAESCAGGGCRGG